VADKEEREPWEGKAPEKEPIVDIFEENDYVTVIAEIPEAMEKDIKTELTGNILEISAGGFAKSITLPKDSRSIIGRAYKNGILQLRIDREICQ